MSHENCYKSGSDILDEPLYTREQALKLAVEQIMACEDLVVDIKFKGLWEPATTDEVMTKLEKLK